MCYHVVRVQADVPDTCYELQILCYVETRDLNHSDQSMNKVKLSLLFQHLLSEVTEMFRDLDYG